MGALAGMAWAALRAMLGSEAGRLVLAVLIAAGAAWAHGEWQYQRGRDAGAASALEQAREDTRNAINELAGAADAARLRRRLCFDSGGVWRLADNTCAAR